LFNGRRIDLDALASQAQEMLRTHACLVPRSAALEWLSRALVLALFSVVIVAHESLLEWSWHALPAALLPFAVIALAGWWLRRMKVHVAIAHMPQVSLPFHAAPLLHRLHLNLTAWPARAQAVLLSLPHIQINQHEATQALMLFAQRMSRNWIELRALIEAALECVITSAQAGIDWIACPLQALMRARAGMTRAPQVITLRC
jgi:hypothetical protein